MIQRIDAPAAASLSGVTSATPDYSTSANPPSIQFSGHPHTLMINGATLDEVAAKPAGTVTTFAVGGSHPHNLKLSTEQAQALVRDGKLTATAEGGHTHTVTFKRQASGDFAVRLKG